MLFQLVELIAFTTVIILAIIIFIIGTYVTRWYAKKKNWDDSLSKAFIVNIIWLITGIPISLLIDYLFGADYLFGLIELVLAIIIGAIVVKIVYKKEYGESIVFVIVVQIVLFLIALLVAVVLVIILGIVLVALLI